MLFKILLLFLVPSSLLAGIELKWKKVPEASSYDLQIFNDQECKSLMHDFEVDAPPFEEWDPPGEGTFSWHVRGKNRFVKGPFSRCGEIIVINKIPEPELEPAPKIEVSSKDKITGPNNTLILATGVLLISGSATSKTGQVPDSDYEGGALNLQAIYRRTFKNSKWMAETSLGYHQVKNSVEGLSKINGNMYKFDLQSGRTFKLRELKLIPTLGVVYISLPVNNSPTTPSHLQTSWFLPFVGATLEAQEKEYLWRVQAKVMAGATSIYSLQSHYHWNSGNWAHGPFWEWSQFKSTYKLENESGISLGNGNLDWNHHFLGWSLSRKF